MRRLFKILGVTLLVIILLLVGIIAYFFISANVKSHHNLALAGPEVKTLVESGYSFRDLNKNGKLDIYEDGRQPIAARVENLLGQMNLEEKAGLMFFNIANVSSDGALSEHPEFSNLFSWLVPSNSEEVLVKKMNHFNVLKLPEPRLIARWQNNMQHLAERTRLGIPITLGTDPRSHFISNPLVSMLAGDFSLWPEPLGLGAIGDSALVDSFARIVRDEYTSVGLRVALHPQVDLATEPRWSRINTTFGEDAQLTSKLAYAYIRGFQGDSLGPTSVACMTKHFPGGGPQKEGLDPHFQFQRGQVYPGHNFNYHLIPFEAAFAAGTAAIMPYYGVPMGQTSEDVGMSFNKDIVTGLLRNKYHFDGVVCTDWGLVTDVDNIFITFKARAHGVMNLSPSDRMLKIINAGVDQFGGESEVDMLIQLVRSGKISEERINQSVRRLLRQKFQLGLFDNPFVDEEKAVQTVGKAEYKKAGLDAQHRSLVLLKNGQIAGQPALPLALGTKVYIEGFDKKVVSQFATVVDRPEDAQVALIRLQTPYVPRKGLIESLMHDGDLDFKEPEKARILALLKKVPTIVSLYLERPAVIPEIAESSAGLLANFGATDQAILDVVFGRARPGGKLPIELPRSMEAVREQKEDLPYDSRDPLFPFGFGLSYP